MTTKKLASKKSTKLILLIVMATVFIVSGIVFYKKNCQENCIVVIKRSNKFPFLEKKSLNKDHLQNLLSSAQKANLQQFHYLSEKQRIYVKKQPLLILIKEVNEPKKNTPILITRINGQKKELAWYRVNQTAPGLIINLYTQSLTNKYVCGSNFVSESIYEKCTDIKKFKVIKAAFAELIRGLNYSGQDIQTPYDPELDYEILQD